MQPASQYTPRTRILTTLLIASTPLLLWLIRFDPVFALTIWMTLFLSLIAWYIPLRGHHKILLLTSVYTIIGMVLYRFVSICLFLECQPVPWAEQVATAEHAIARYGNDFTLYAIQARPDFFPRFRSEDLVNWRLSFLFIRTTPNPQPTDAPFQIYTIDLNDRDPQRTVEFVPGSAWMNPVIQQLRAQAFTAVVISPREAAERVKQDRKQQHLPAISDRDLVVSLLLDDAVPRTLHVPAVWRVTSKYSSEDTVPSYWIDARSGVIVNHQESK